MKNLTKTIVTIILTSIIFFHLNAQYKIGKTQAIGFTLVGLGGFIDGLVEGYEFDGRTSFERKFGADPNGFWGSESWRNVYKDGNPDNGYKSWMHAQIGAFDFYHVGDKLRKGLYISGGIVISIGEKRKFKYYLYDFLIATATSSFTKRMGMMWIRN